MSQPPPGIGGDTTTASSPATRSELWLRALAESRSTGLFVLREQVLHANKMLATLLDSTVEEVLALDPAALLPGEIRQQIERRATASGDGGARSYRLRLQGRDGTEHWVEIIAEAVALPDGPAILGLVRGRLADPAATAGDDESADWFRVLAETTSTAIFVYRERFLWANRAFLELTGFSLDELTAMNSLELVHPDFREGVARRRDARLRGEPAPQQYEMLIITRRGEERWLHFTAARIRFRGEMAALGTAFDITDQKLAELALRTSEERLHMAQRAAGIVTWDWSLLTDEMVITSPAPPSLGLAPNEMPRTSAELFDKWVHPEDRRRLSLAVRKTLKDGSDLVIEHRFQAPGGEVRWLTVRGQAIQDETGWVVRMVGVSADITERKLAELAMRESSDRLRLMVEQIPAVLWTTDQELRFTSSVGAGLAGLGLKANEVVGMRVLDYLASEGPESTAIRAHRRALAGESVSYEQSWASHIHQTHVEPLRDTEGGIVGTIGIALDVTERRRVEEALRRERERADITLASIDDGVIRTNAAGVVEYLNPVAERLTGIASEEARGRPLEEIYRVFDEETKKPLLNPVVRCLRESRPVMLPGRRIMTGRDGTEVSIRDSAAPIRGADGQILGAVLAFKDVTVVRDMERAMSHLANHDNLTGLLNRSAFERRLAHALEATAATGKPFSVVQLDLGLIKVVNDTCGHWAGDEMLRNVSRLLLGLASEQSSVARLGAEEFGLLYENLSVVEARQRTTELRAALEEYRFVWEDRSFEMRASFGLARAAPGDTVSGLMIAIDIACMLAKESGRFHIHEYQADDERLIERYGEMHWIHRIYKALQQERFRLYCQPIRPLVNDDEDGMLGEVLLRMVGDDGELVLPRTFVPAAERYRLMSLVDRWVVRRSFDTLARGASVSGRPVSRLAINLSGESLNEESFLEFVIAQLEDTKLPAHRVLFEITETAAIANLAGAMRFISELQDRGAAFILDDFGSGLSSFAYLKNLPVDYLKIASEFVRGLADSPMHRILVRSINQIGHELGLKTIAEGVETPEMLTELEEIQIDYVQGYWIARPEPLEGA